MASKVIGILLKNHGGTFRGERVGFPPEEARRLAAQGVFSPDKDSAPVMAPRGIGPEGKTTAPKTTEGETPKGKDETVKATS